MKVLVTGATGFLGRHVLEALDGHEIVPFSRAVGDVRDLDSVRRAVAGCDAVIHAAGLVAHRDDAAQALWDVHVTGTENVLVAARDAGVRRVVVVSTSGVVAVSETEAVRDESSPTPLAIVQQWPYYRAKLFAEQKALAFEGLEVLALNPSLLLGPGDVNSSSTAAVRLFLDGQVLAAPPGGLSFADARDVARTSVDALSRGRPGERYLLGAVNLSFRLFYDRLARIADRPPPRFDAPRAVRRVLDWFPSLGKDGFATGYEMNRIELQMACHWWWLDDAKARRELGWSPRDPGETLADTVEDVKWRGLVRA